MLLDTSPAFPSLETSSSFAYYPYPQSSSFKTLSLIRGPQSSSKQAVARDDNSVHATSAPSGPGPTSEMIRSERLHRERAERRALAGRRPAGVGLGREAEEMSDEEAALEDEKVRLPSTSSPSHVFVAFTPTDVGKETIVAGGRADA